MRRSWIMLAAVLCAVLPARADLIDAIEAIVDDAVITYHEVSAIGEEPAASLIRRYRNQPEVLEKELAALRTKTLQQLMDRQLILHEFKTAGYSLPESVINDLVEESIKNDFGDRATMAKTLEQTGVTQERYRQRIRDRFIETQLRLKNVTSEIIVSPHKVEAYYLAHKDEFKVEDEAKLSVIVLKGSNDTNGTPAALAQDILTKLEGGAAFPEMAKLYSQGSQRAQGGEWGWWPKTQLTKGLADVAFALEPGKCSGVFSRSSGDDYWVVQYEHGQPTLARHYGLDAAKKQVVIEERHCAEASSCAELPTPMEYYILKLEDKHTAHFKSLGEVRDQIDRALREEERTRLNNQWLDKLRKKTFVRTFL